MSRRLFLLSTHKLVSAASLINNIPGILGFTVVAKSREPPFIRA